MAIVDSLKKLLVKFGGNPSALEENATSSDVIDAISEAYTDKEGTYTEVTPIVTEGTKVATIKTNNVDHDIYAPKELPAVTSEDYEKILQVDDQGNWVAVHDRFHVGDEYEIPHQYNLIAKCTNLSKSSFMLTIPLPKFIDSDVKWFEFTGTNATVAAARFDGTDLNTGEPIVPINDAFEVAPPGYTQIGNNYIAMIAKFKAGSGISLASLNLYETFAIQFNFCWIRFLDAKPTT